MIHAYNLDYLNIIINKVGSIFELAVNKESYDIDKFMNIFIESDISYYLENANPIYALGKSSNELLALITNKEPKEYYESNYASPEYWTGYVLAYASWYLNKSFKEITSYVKASLVLNNYFPYHEMDISRIVKFINSKLPKINRLKEFRLKNNLSQNELSIMSGVPIRNIRAYEQEKLDISKAQVDTVYNLSRALNCSIEALIK